MSPMEEFPKERGPAVLNIPIWLMTMKARLDLQVTKLLKTFSRDFVSEEILLQRVK
jgi:hypothetical protein